MEIKEIKTVSEKLYEEIEENGIEAIKKLFFKGTGLSQELRVDPLQEYIKKILISQMDIDKMLFLHKYVNTSSNSITAYREETKKLRRQINSDSTLKFDEDTINVLFGNSLGITSNDDYEEWKEFSHSNMHNGIGYDTIFFEEEFKYNYDNENNIIKKFFKSFYYKRIMKRGMLEDVYARRVREMLKKEIFENPENTFIAYNNVHRLLEKGVAEYEEIKEIEEIARMTLKPFIGPQTQRTINIVETCRSIISERRSQIGASKTGEEYRQKAVTMGAKTMISNRPVIETIPFDEIPRAMEELQGEYENIYNNEQSIEGYIKGVTKIYADFMFIQPYQDGNKRIALCLLNSMLMSKNVTPPVVSLVNDEEMVKAFHKAGEKDYDMLQRLVIEKCTEMKKTSTDDIGIINRSNEKGFEME